MMDGAALSAPVADWDSLDQLRTLRGLGCHWGRWVSAAVLLFLAFALAWSLAHNPNVGWSTIGQYLFKPLTLRGVLVTIEMTIIAMVIGIAVSYTHLTLPTKRIVEIS